MSAQESAATKAARVVLPLAGPGLGAAASMVFISVVTELNATLLLSPIGTHTLATRSGPTPRRSRSPPPRPMPRC